MAASPTAAHMLPEALRTTLERAHTVAHALRDAIEDELGDAEVLIHVEPESSRRDPAESPEPYRAG